MEAAVIGDFCVLRFRLEGFVVASDVQTFNSELREITDDLPHWASAGKLSGSFCQQIARLPTSIRESSRVDDWQTLCKQLYAHAQFAKEPFFYFVRSLNRLGGRQIAQTDGKFEVVEDDSFELNIVHYTPNGEVPTQSVSEMNWLLVATGSEAVSVVANPNMAVDSDYDIKLLRFTVPPTANPVSTVLSLYRHINVAEPPTIEKAIWDFDLLLTVVSRRTKRYGLGVVVGLALAIPGIATTWSNISIPDKWPLTWISLLGGIVAGMVASLGLRKP